MWGDKNMNERTAEISEIIISILFLGCFVGAVVFVVFNTCGLLSSEEIIIITITDKWTDYDGNFFILDSNYNIYKIFSLKEEHSISYRYKQIIIGDEYKLTVKTLRLSKTVLLLNEKKII